MGPPQPRSEIALVSSSDCKVAIASLFQTEKQ
jgi:hypothetical protein